LVLKEGEKASIEVVKEYGTQASIKNRTVVPCGTIYELTPTIDKTGIRIVGKAILRRSTNMNAKGVATLFKSQEVLIDIHVADGLSKAIDLDGGGQIIITPVIIDNTGQPIKQ
jgi:hypothetical protein